MTSSRVPLVRWAGLLGASVGLLSALMWALAAVEARSVRVDVDTPVVDGLGWRAGLLAAGLVLGGATALVGLGRSRAGAPTRLACGVGVVALMLSAMQLAAMPEVGSGELGGWLVWQYGGAALLLLAALLSGPPAPPGRTEPVSRRVLLARAAAGVPLLVILALTVASARREGLVGVHVEDESAWDFDLPLLLVATPLLALLAGARGRWWEPVVAVTVLVVPLVGWAVGLGAG